MTRAKRTKTKRKPKYKLPVRALEFDDRDSRSYGPKYEESDDARDRKPKRNFILCPHCQSKSKVLHSEFGGLQTRRCKNGHRFEYDKWIGDRMGMIAIFGGKIANPYVKY